MEVIFEALAEAWDEQAAANDTMRDILHALQQTDGALIKELTHVEWAIWALVAVVVVLALDRIWQRVKRRVVD